jgi:hypothetical protein
MQGGRHLLQVVQTLHTVGRFADLLDSGEQECNQDRDDRHDYQQLNERKASLLLGFTEWNG